MKRQRISQAVREECVNFWEKIKRKGIDIPREITEKSGCANVFCDGDTL
jgi:hypothetical protein